MYLDMSACTIKGGDLDLEDILSTCHTLRKLSLEKVNNLTNNICNLIVQNASTLTVLNLGDCSGLANAHEGIKVIITKCQNLMELNFSWTDMKKYVSFFILLCRAYFLNHY